MELYPAPINSEKIKTHNWASAAYMTDLCLTVAVSTTSYYSGG